MDASSAHNLYRKFLDAAIPWYSNEITSPVTIKQSKSLVALGFCADDMVPLASLNSDLQLTLGQNAAEQVTGGLPSLDQSKVAAQIG